MIGKAGLSPIYKDYSNVSLGKKRKEINKHFDNLHVCISNFSRGKLLEMSELFRISFTETSVKMIIIAIRLSYIYKIGK